MSGAFGTWQPADEAKARAKALCDAEVAAGRLTPDHHQRPLLERTIARLAEAQARDDARVVGAHNLQHSRKAA